MCKSTLEVHAGWAGHVCAAQHGRGPYARRDVSSSMRQFFGDDFLFSLGSAAATESPHRGLPVGTGRSLFGRGGGMVIA